MLYGGFDRNIDKKGRFAIPSKLRTDLGETFIICKSLFGKRCLCAYPMDKWEKLVAKIGDLPMSKSTAVKRFLYDGAFNVEFDSQGRILLPATLREYASLDTEAHILGVVDNLEIWNKDLWAKESSENTPEVIASIVSELEF